MHYYSITRDGKGDAEFTNSRIHKNARLLSTYFSSGSIKNKMASQFKLKNLKLNSFYIRFALF